jgi:hypothetical protein
MTLCIHASQAVTLHSLRSEAYHGHVLFCWSFLLAEVPRYLRLLIYHGCELRTPTDGRDTRCGSYLFTVSGMFVADSGSLGAFSTSASVGLRCPMFVFQIVLGRVSRL